MSKASELQLKELTAIIKHEELKGDKQYYIDLADLLKNIYKKNLTYVKNYKKQISKTPDKLILFFLGKK